MRVCLVGEYSGNIDEGVRQVASSLYGELSRNHKVLNLDIRTIFRFTTWNDARNFKPAIIHYLLGPSFLSLIVTRLLSVYCGGAKTIVSAIMPSIPHFLQKFIFLVRPDMILTQSREAEARFAGLGCRVAFLPNGIDVEKFRPASKEQRDRLREKYGVDKGKYVILHVGSIKQKRNLYILKNLQTSNNQVLIIGSTSMKAESEVYSQLQSSGVQIWRTYFDNINEIYALADCYLFPVRKTTAAIEMPLSIMEAMACNLPVISTRFGALPRVFEEGDGLFFVDQGDEFLDKIQAIKQGKVSVRTREKVLPYSWQEVTRRLEEIYNEVISH